MRNSTFNAGMILISAGCFATTATAQTTSPYSPPTEKLGVYVKNSGGGLDTGCTFRDGGPLVVEIDIPMVINETKVDADGKLSDASGMVDRKVIGQQATINFPSFDVDSGAVIGGGFAPEVDVISFNDVEIGTLTGSNNTWTPGTKKVDIGEIKFGQTNTFKIDIDTENSEQLWCTALDWVSIEFDVAYPYILVHGQGSAADAWDPVVETIDEYGVLYQAVSLTRNGRAAANGAELKTIIQNFLEPLKSDSVNIFGNSKGGVDTQELAALETDFKIRSLSTFGTPHLGTVVADIGVFANRQVDQFVQDGDDPNRYLSGTIGALRTLNWVDNNSDRTFPDLPGLLDMTTYGANIALNNGKRGNIRAIYSIAADADKNRDGELSIPEVPLALLRAVWTTVRDYSAVFIIKEFERPDPNDPSKTITVLEFETSANAVPQPNDTTVTIPSAQPSYTLQLPVFTALHAKVDENPDAINAMLDRTAKLRD